MSLPEIIPSNLPIFVQNKNRSAFANSVIPSGSVLLFAESDGNGGSKLIAKNPDGSFSEVGGGGGGGESFYKCASVDTANEEWTGYLASIDSTTGIWSFAETTSGLTYERFMPVVGAVYDENCTFEVKRYKSVIPTGGLVFYASFNGDTPATAETGQAISTAGTVTYTSVNNIPCASLSSSSYLYGSDTTALPTGQNVRTISAWFKLNSYNDADGSTIFCYGTNANNSRYTIGVQSSTIFIAAYNNTAVLQTSFSLNTWYHIIVYYTGSTEFMYINGALLGSVSHVGLNTGSAGWCIGAQWGEFNYGRLAGYISAVRVYNRILTSEEITSLAAEFTPVVSA